MSKLIERLEKLDAPLLQPLGFGAIRTQTKPASMLLIALADAEATETLTRLPVEFCVLAAPSIADGEAVNNNLGDVLWGLWPGTVAKESLDDLKEQGGDFFIFSELDAPAEVLAGEELGRLIAIPADFPEELGRSLEEIPVEAVLLTGLEDAEPLSVKNLMQVRSIRDLTSKPLLLLRSCLLSQGELTVLQDAGVQAIVLDLRQMQVEDALRVKEAIDNLPPRKTKRDQPTPTLPRMASMETAHQHEHEEDPDDDRLL